MKRVFITLTICLAFIGLAQAQLSEGKTYSSKIINGNRPECGDWGLYFGPSFLEIKELVNPKIDVIGLPLINVKYYATDNLEIRAGFQYGGKTTKANGNYDQEYILEDNTVEKSIPLTNKYFSRNFRFSPGVAYHFSPKNILDVYMGASIPFGIDVQSSVFETELYKNEENELKKYSFKNNNSYNSFVVGLNAFIGLQAFVADLPLSLGFEYGLSGLLRTNDQTYHERTDMDGNTQKFYTSNHLSNEFTSLDCRSKYMNSDVRFTITYYFNNK